MNSQPQPNTARLITIEADGNSFKGPRKPKIRLSGKWLEAAGFPPGQKVQVTFIDTGVMQLRIQQS